MNGDDSVPVARTRSRDLQARRKTRTQPDSPSRGDTLSRRLYTGLFLIVSLAALAAASAGVFTVRSVEVVGNNLPQDAIAQAAGVTGQNIFAVRSDDVVARLSAVPAIQVSRVEVAFPDRVIVYAGLRQAIIGWRQSSGITLIDTTGQAIGETLSTALPIIQGTSPPTAAIALAVRYAATSLPGTIEGAPTGYSLDRVTGLTISGKSGWTAIVGNGSAELLLQRIATLEALLRELAKESKQLGTVDLRTQNPVFKLAGT